MFEFKTMDHSKRREEREDDKHDDIYEIWHVAVVLCVEKNRYVLM